MVYFEYEDIKCLFYSVRKAGNEKRIINLNNIRLNCKNYEKVGKSARQAVLIMLRLVMHSSQILHLSDPRYATLKVRVNIWT